MSIKIIEESLVVGLNSKDAIKLNDTKLSNVLFNFRGLIRHNHRYKNLKVQVLDAIIPHSFYNINSTNNLLVIDYIDYIIEAGNYSQHTLFIELRRILPQSFTISFIKVTGKISFVSSSEFIINQESTILGLLGFDYVDNVSVDNNLEADYPLYLAGNKILKIASKALSCNNHDSFNNNNNHILTFISINSPPHSIIYYKHLSNIHFPMKNDYINEIDIQFLDENNQFIDFNNTSWSIVLSVTYEKEIIDDTISLQDYKNQIPIDESLGKEKQNIDDVTQPIEIIRTNDNDLDILLYDNHIYR